jgi:5-methyltetrahydrofolate--homocysteine methyltransferase
MRLLELAAESRPVVADGAMGTQLQERGLEPGEPGERWNLERPQEIERVHRSYAAAGARILTTNTFGATRARLELQGLADATADVNRAAAAIARRVADASGGLVAGDVGPSGELLAPLGTLSEDDAVELFREQIEALCEGGVDLLLVETMSDLTEAGCALRAARVVDPALDVAVTLSFDTNGRTMMGVAPERAVAAMGGAGALAVGANCGRSLDELEATMAAMREARPEGLLLVAQPNAGLPQLHGDAFRYDVGPEQLAAHALRLRDLGVDVIGACCGSTPAHIEAVARAVAG